MGRSLVWVLYFWLGRWAVLNTADVARFRVGALVDLEQPFNLKVLSLHIFIIKFPPPLVLLFYLIDLHVL